MLAFLALFAFFDLMSELGSVGRGPYQLEHALLYVSLGLPAYAYELMPIVTLIGTIFIMAQLAARSEFTVMRASSLSMAGAWLVNAYRVAAGGGDFLAGRVYQSAL